MTGNKTKPGVSMGLELFVQKTHESGLLVNIYRRKDITLVPLDLSWYSYCISSMLLPGHTNSYQDSYHDIIKASIPSARRMLLVYQNSMEVQKDNISEKPPDVGTLTNILMLGKPNGKTHTWETLGIGE